VVLFTFQVNQPGQLAVVANVLPFRVTGIVETIAPSRLAMSVAVWKMVPEVAESATLLPVFWALNVASAAGVAVPALPYGVTSSLAPVETAPGFAKNVTTPSESVSAADTPYGVAGVAELTVNEDVPDSTAPPVGVTANPKAVGGGACAITAGEPQAQPIAISNDENRRMRGLLS
jgi:hypothetical protein